MPLPTMPLAGPVAGAARQPRRLARAYLRHAPARSRSRFPSASGMSLAGVRRVAPRGRKGVGRHHVGAPQAGHLQPLDRQEVKDPAKIGVYSS